MKDFVIKNLENFLDIVETIETPFKFYEIIREFQGEKQLTRIKASVWVRTALISWEESFKTQEEASEAIGKLSKNNFVHAEIRETPFVIR